VGCSAAAGTLDEQCRDTARLGIKGYDLIRLPKQ
jgi:hypothetical protein